MLLGFKSYYHSIRRKAASAIIIRDSGFEKSSIVLDGNIEHGIFHQALS